MGFVAGCGCGGDRLCLVVGVMVPMVVTVVLFGLRGFFFFFFFGGGFCGRL